MKILSYITVLLMSVSLFIACDPDDPEFKDVDTSKINEIFNEISGASEAFASGQDVNSYTYTAHNRDGSTFVWEVEGSSATVTQDPDNPFMAHIVYGQSSTDISGVKVKVTETTEWGLTQSFEETVNLKAFCPVDLSAIAGSYEEYGYDGTYEYTTSATLATDPSDPLFGLIINDFAFNDGDYWCDQAGASIKILLNGCDNSIIVNEQDVEGLADLCGYSGPYIRPVEGSTNTYDPDTGIIQFSAEVRVDAGSFGALDFTYTPN